MKYRDAYPVEWIPISEIDVTEHRKNFGPVSPGRIENMVRRIQVTGGEIANALIVRRLRQDDRSGREFELVTGLCRLRAYQALQRQEAPCRVMDLTEREAITMRIAEDASLPGKPILPRGWALRDYEKITGWTQKEISQVLGLGKSMVSEGLKFARHLPRPVFRKWVQAIAPWAPAKATDEFAADLTKIQLEELVNLKSASEKEKRLRELFAEKYLQDHEEPEPQATGDSEVDEEEEEGDSGRTKDEDPSERADHEANSGTEGTEKRSRSASADLDPLLDPDAQAALSWFEWFHRLAQLLWQILRIRVGSSPIVARIRRANSRSTEQDPVEDERASSDG